MDYKRIKTDVLVIGGGLTGHMAAYWTSEKRSTVLLSTGRGASPFISGYNVPVTKEDSIESFIADTTENSHGVGRSDLIRLLCEKSVDTVPFWRASVSPLIKPTGSLMCGGRLAHRTPVWWGRGIPPVPLS